MPPKTRGEPLEPSLEVFGQGVRDQLEQIGRRFKRPDDDWINGLLHLENERHEHEVYGLTNGLFAPERKAALFAYLAELLKARKAIRYALMTNAWALAAKPQAGESLERAGQRLEATTDEWSGHFGEHPERIEVLWLEIVDRERGEAWRAEIKRFPDKPPQLGSWERFEGEVGGRIPELRKALQ